MSQPKFMIVAPHTASFFMLRMDLAKAIARNSYDIIIVAPSKDNYDKEITSAGMRYISINLDKSSLNPISSLSYQKSLVNIIKREKPDKVFAYTSKPVIFGSIAAHRAGVKEIYSLVCGLGSVYASKGIKNRILQAIMGMLYTKAFKYNKKVIFQNQDDIDEFVHRKYLSRNKCELVNGSGVNMAKFKYQPLPKEPSFIMVSRIIKEKGIQEYFEAAELVKQQYPKVQFTYIGDYDKSYKKDFQKLKPYIDGGIIKYIPTTNKVFNYLTNSQVFVLPSYYREGVPRTILEALAVGRPIITTKTPGCKETVRDYKNGLFVKVRDARDLADKMIWMIENQAKLPNMSKECHKLCREKFAIDIINKQTLKIMEINC